MHKGNVNLTQWTIKQKGVTLGGRYGRGVLGSWLEGSKGGPRSRYIVYLYGVSKNIIKILKKRAIKIIGGIYVCINFLLFLRTI